MAKGKAKKQDVDLNLTSMLDVVFQLIVFFLLVTNFTSAELPELEVPIPDHSEARMIKDRKKVVVNIVPDKGDKSLVKGVKVGLTMMNPGEYGRLTDIIEFEVEKDPSVEVDLRVDKAVHYAFVQPVMNAITKAGVSRINLVALSEDMQD